MPAIKQKYILDLLDIFDRAFAGKNKELRSQLRPLLSDPGVKENIGREVIVKIQERTESGIDKNNKGFKKPYSKSYARSLVFKIYGKSPSDVNLKLTGEMLANMQQNVSNGPKIVIDFASDQQNAKADGHIRGGGRNNSLPVRDFFGLPAKEEEKIVKEVVESVSRSGVVLNIGDFIDQTESAQVTGKIGEVQEVNFSDFLFEE